MAYDKKYGKVTLEHGSIGDDEPVMVFRAQDKILPNVIAHYHMVCMNAGSPLRHLRLIAERFQEIKDWQAEHSTQVPTSESSRAWMEN
jgi:hypothetical protein